MESASSEKASGQRVMPTLPEFPDPDGQWSYFRLDGEKGRAADELFAAQPGKL